MGEIHIGGDNYGPINTGSGRQDNRGMTIGPALASLQDLLDRHAAALPEGEQARADLADVREQAAEPSPDRRRLTDALRRLAERVAAVGALAAAVRDVAEKLGVGL